MKPPLSQIANQVSKIEVSWPATLPLPRIAPLMSKVASMIPDLPGTDTKARSIADSRVPTGMITDISQLQRGTTVPIEIPMAKAKPEPIFESVVESPSYQGGDFTQNLIRPTFE